MTLMSVSSARIFQRALVGDRSGVGLEAGDGTGADYTPRNAV